MIPAWANCEINETLGGSVLVGPNGQVWHVYDAEQGSGPTDPLIAKCIFGPGDKLMVLPFNPTRYDVMFVYCVPNAGESLDAMRTRFASDFWTVYADKPIATPLGVVCYIRTNNVLSETDIANGIEACSQLECPVLVFRAWGQDVPPSAIDRVTYWRNGQGCPPQALPPSDSTAAVKLLMEK